MKEAVRDVLLKFPPLQLLKFALNSSSSSTKDLF